MQCPRLTLLTAMFAAFVMMPAVAVAQDDAKETSAVSTTDDAAQSDDSKSDDSKSDDSKSDDSKSDDSTSSEKKSADGSYEWKRSFGAGIEAGLWFTPLNRWESNLMLDTGLGGEIKSNPMPHLDLAIEASLLEGTRLTLFGGIQRPFSGEPKIGAWYLGIEPAFAFRRDMWELALGIGAGLGSTGLELESGESMKAGLVLLRPFVEVRRYLGTVAAVYLRGGFNQWLVNNPELEGINFEAAETNLDEGAPFVALGVRFGHYPKHIKVVGDRDGDGLLDDIDECPDEPEDFDGFEDEDGCPDLDNDGDGIPDDKDQCPNEPEDFDGYEDEDGCPDLDKDSDRDGDGIKDDVDQCPEEPEDFDGFEDADGCPDPDNDGDGIPDTEDECPDVAGVAAKKGCPFELVEVTEDRIVIKERVFFDLNKATIQEQSFPLLDQVAETIIAFPRIKLIEVQGHTDHKGRAEYNKKLSDDRAKSVYEYILGKGVEPERLQYKGYGMEQPLIPLPENGKETEEAAAQNRRVEFRILQQDVIQKRVREDRLQGATKAQPEGADAGEGETPATDGETPDAGATDGAAPDAAPQPDAPTE